MESTEKPATPFFHSLENLSPEDRILFHRFGRGRYIKPPHNIIHHASEAIASVQGNATAVQQHDGASISYAELNQRANILANELRSRHGFSKGDRAVLVFSRSIDMVIFIFAVLKAGGQYVPVDGGVVPVETLGHIISDSDASIVLHMPRYKQKVEESILLAKRRSVTVMNIDDNSDFWAHGDTSSPDVNVGPQDGAYVIYTSGTTGLPKGVDVTHGGVTNTLLLEPAKLGITVGKKVAQQLNVGFDMGAWEILGTLMNGGTLYTRGSGDDNWTKCLQQVDIVISTPTVALKRFPRHDEFPNLETIVVGGEPCPETLANHWAPHANFINACGPTEISVMNTAHLHRAGQRLTIGKPIANTTVYLLDDDENPAPIGEPGTMWVGGAGVSRGYLNLPELTAARYKPDKFTGDGNTMFNTGDLARWLPDGNLETLGRKDDQVKIHGFRVELDGVSRAIEAHPAVTKACALKIGDELWGFYSSHAPVDEKELRETAGTHQPFYAVPNIWWHVAIMPLTANGKIDKKALRNLADTDHHSRSTLFEPNDTDIEKTAALDGDLDVADNDKPEEDSEAVSLPPKKGIHGWRWLRHTALSAYRKLFGIVLVANTTALAVMLHQNRHTNYRLPLSSLATAVSANLLASVLLRQDHIVNLIFWLATRLPTTTPLSIRRHLARVYHYGGIHSGSAIAASTWWLIYTITATLPSPTPIPFQTPIRILSYTILSLLLAIITMAHPTLRAKLHNQFELTHRFAGWTALALVWAHLILTTMSTSKAASFPLGTTILTTPSIYLLSLTTLCIALPWLRLRRVPCYLDEGNTSERERDWTVLAGYNGAESAVSYFVVHEKRGEDVWEGDSGGGEKGG
ncbi:hypothetical protein OQA88_1127 [Cercophora sp. LCS_1]